MAGNSQNRPKKGDRITVDPIRDLKDVATISELIKSSPRNHLLFVMGINNGLRCGDLLRLKVKDLRNLKPGSILKIKERKTGKPNVLAVNKTVYKSLKNYLDKVQPDDEDYLFKSNKGNNRPITIQAANNYIKKWTKAIRLDGNYGTHSLRKTWGYMQRTVYGVGFELICKRFNHSSPAVTMRYLGIEDKEVNTILMNEIC